MEDLAEVKRRLFQLIHEGQGMYAKYIRRRPGLKRLAISAKLKVLQHKIMKLEKILETHDGNKSKKTN